MSKFKVYRKVSRTEFKIVDKDTMQEALNQYTNPGNEFTVIDAGTITDHWAVDISGLYEDRKKK